MFEFWDDTLEKLLPDASIKFSPMIASSQRGWLVSELHQSTYEEINRCIRSRPHVEFDSFEPANTGILKDEVHMKDGEGITFWKRIFNQLK